MKLYSNFVRHIYYPVSCFLKREPVFDYLRVFEKNQWKAQEEILIAQEKKLLKMLRYAYENIPFYRQKYLAEKIDPKDIRNSKDFSMIPQLSKEEVRTYLPSLQNRQFKGKRYQGVTSGSTGKPLIVYYDSDFMASTWASRWRGRGFWDVRIGDREVTVWGRPLNSTYELLRQQIKSRLKNVLFFSAFSLSDKKLKSYWLKMIKFNPDYIYGYPSAIYQLCQYAKGRGICLQGLKAVFCAAETLYAHQKELMRQILKGPAINEYGCSESGAFAYECSEGNLHISAENVYVEFEADNRQVSPGEIGEIVVTNLNNYYMPLIRYKVGDVGKYQDKTCACGRGLPTMEISVGKTGNIITTRSGRRIHSSIFNYINKYLLKNKIFEIDQFRIIRKKPNLYLVQIVKNNDLSESALELFSNKMKEFLGIDITIEYEFLKAIPRDPTGKIRYYISEPESKND